MATSSTVLLRRLVTRAKFRHLEVVLRVAELGSMRRAAEAVGMTQPSISQLIAELEALLETPLFFRHARGVVPTGATLELLPVARRILGALGEGAEIFASRLENDRSIIRAAATEAGLLGLVHSVLPGFASANPQLHVLVEAATGRDPLALIAEDACDILCIRQQEVIPKGWEFVTCRKDALITVSGPDHPLTHRTSITLDMLGRERWLMNRVDSIARQRFDEVFEAEGWDETSRCNIVVHVPELTRQMIAAGGYLALVPASVASPYLAEGSMVELPGALTFPLAPLGFFWKGEEAGRAVRLFAAALRKGADKKEQPETSPPVQTS
ncbi:MAG: LysR family transcriptional regulator [Roseibium sp.]